MVALLLLVIIMLVTAIPLLTNLARRPRGMIRNYILRVTPIETSIEDVIEIIESRDDWGIANVDYERGFSPYSFRGPPPVGQPDIPRIGEKSIIVNIGSYRAWYGWFLHTGVSVSWGFDADGKLIEVHVRKVSGP